MERFLLKIFANSPTVQTGVFGSETVGNIQYSEDPTTIQSLSAWSEGLGGATSNATKQPAINDIQGVFKVLSSAIKNNQVSGIPLYLSTETYQIGSIVLNIEDNEPVLYYSLTANNTGNALTDDTNWAKLNIGSNGLPIGSIFHSALPLSNENLHLLNGDFLPFDGVYSSFYNYIKTIYDGGSYTQLFITQEEYQQQIANNGNCANFVFEEGVGVRLPTINGWIKGITSIDDLGTLNAELPNLKGEVGKSISNAISGIFSKGRSASDSQQTSGSGNIINCDASTYNSIYKDGARVQPDGVAYFTYIVVANGLSEDEITVDINNVLSDLQNKVDKDGSNAEFNNLSANAKSNIINLFQVDYSAGISISSTTYTPPANGIIIGNFQSTSANSFGAFYNTTQRIAGISNGLSGQFLSTLILVNKGEEYKFDIISSNITFYPFKNQI